MFRLQPLGATNRQRFVSLVFFLSGFAHCGFSIAGSEPTQQPMLRVETGMHTTLIRRLTVDPERNRVITAGDDKTVRVWQMPQALLIATLRVPIDEGNEGQLFAVAVSPDGQTVATAGWTGWDWDGKTCIYFFDVASSELVRRRCGLPYLVNMLTWTRNGQHLLVGLQPRGGLRVLRSSDLAEVAADPDYNDKLTDADLRQDGIIATTSNDGWLRLYTSDFKLAGRRRAAGGVNPVSLRFSPDGEKLAVGFLDTPTVSIINVRDLALAFAPDLAGLRDQAGFTSVVWSSDGRSLYAGGDFRGVGKTPLYRWSEAGHGARQTIPLTENRIVELQQMRDGRIAFAAEDPSFGIVGSDGNTLAYRGPAVIDHSHSQLAVSADATVIRYATSRDGLAMNSFTPLLGGDQSLASTPRQPVQPALTEAPGWKIENWKGSYKPTINGKAPQLDDYEQSRAYAISPDSRSVLFGTEWALRLLDRDAKLLWHVRLPAVAWSVNIARNGRFAVAALSDGTIRWYRMDTGQEILAYFPHQNGSDWICWVPQGYYLSSVYGDNYVGWHLNRGRDLTPDFYRAVQFDRILYRPDVIAAVLRPDGASATRALTPGPQADFQIAQLRDIAPPRVKVKTQESAIGPNESARLDLVLSAEKTGLDISDVTVFVNNIPVTPRAERRAQNGARIERKVSVALTERENHIRVEAFNGVSMGIAETDYAVPATRKVNKEPGDLYLLAVGANVFPGLPTDIHLAYAASDADEFSASLKRRASGFFRQVHSRVLSDNTPTLPLRAEIVKALEFLSAARAEDTVIIFLASHGISDPAGNYYFVPRDVQAGDLKLVAKGGAAQSMLPWQVFFDALRGLAGRRLLIVDTCQARNIEGRFESHSLMKRSASSLFALIVAAKGNEESQEYEPGKHGLFTYAMLTALAQASDPAGKGLVSLNQVFNAATPIVERLRDKTIGPQTPQMIAPFPLGETPLLRNAPLPLRK